jgi:hypothetical protein
MPLPARSALASAAFRRVRGQQSGREHKNDRVLNVEAAKTEQRLQIFGEDAQRARSAALKKALILIGLEPPASGLGI